MNFIYKSIITSLFLTQLLFAQSVDLKLLKDAVIFRDNRLYQVSKDGALKLVEADFDLGSSKISKNGDIRLDGGQRIKLKNGEAFTKKGDLVVMEEAVFKMQGYLFKDKKISFLKEGTFQEINENVVFANGLQLTPTGRLYLKDSTYTQLKEGDFLSLNGELVKRKEEFMQLDGVLMRENKMIKFDNGKGSWLFTDYNATGNRIGTDGVLTTKDGNRINLTDGEYVNTKGEIFFLKSDLLQNIITKRDGKMVLVSEGKIKLIDSVHTFKDSLTLSPGGLLTLANGGKLMLREGDILSIEGLLMISKGVKLDSKAQEARALVDHFVFKHGKVLMVKDGEPSIISKELILPNGNKLSKHGHVVRKDGSKFVLKDGEKIDMKGDLMANVNDKPVEVKPIEAPKADPKPTSVPTDEGPKINNGYLVMREGMMYLVNAGVTNPMTEDITFSDKSQIKKSGDYKSADGKTSKLGNGDRISMSGKILPKERPVLSNYITMRKGKMYVVIERKPKSVDADYVLDDITITPKGLLIKKDNKKQVKEGEQYDFNGELVK